MHTVPVFASLPYNHPPPRWKIGAMAAVQRLIADKEIRLFAYWQRILFVKPSYMTHSESVGPGGTIDGSGRALPAETGKCVDQF